MNREILKPEELLSPQEIREILRDGIIPKFYCVQRFYDMHKNIACESQRRVFADLLLALTAEIGDTMSLFGAGLANKPSAEFSFLGNQEKLPGDALQTMKDALVKIEHHCIEQPPDGFQDEASRLCCFDLFVEVCQACTDCIMGFVSKVGFNVEQFISAFSGTGKYGSIVVN